MKEFTFSKKYSWYRRADLRKNGMDIRIVKESPRKLLTGWKLIEEELEAAYGEQMLEDLITILKKENK